MAGQKGEGGKNGHDHCRRHDQTHLKGPRKDACQREGDAVREVGGGTRKPEITKEARTSIYEGTPHAISFKRSLGDDLGKRTPIRRVMLLGEPLKDKEKEE